jgi:MFS family permease
MGSNPRDFYWGWFVVVGAFLILGINYGGRYSFGTVVCNSSVGKWFIRKRGMAIGAASIGIGFATTVLAPLAGWVIKVYGWRVGFLAGLPVFGCIDDLPPPDPGTAYVPGKKRSG